MARFGSGFIYPSATAAPVTAFIGSQTNNTNASPQTWTNGGGGFDLGAGAANLWAIVAIFYGTTIRNPSSVTIGGVTMTKVVGSATTSRGVDLYYANVPGGGGSNVVANFNIGANTAACAVWTFRGSLDTANIGSSSSAGGSSFSSGANANKANSLAISCVTTASANAVTFTEPSAADFAANQTTSSSFRFAGGNHSGVAAGTYTPNISVGAGSISNAVCGVFPPT